MPLPIKRAGKGLLFLCICGTHADWRPIHLSCACFPVCCMANQRQVNIRRQHDGLAGKVVPIVYQLRQIYQLPASRYLIGSIAGGIPLTCFKILLSSIIQDGFLCVPYGYRYSACCELNLSVCVCRIGANINIFPAVAAVKQQRDSVDPVLEEIYAALSREAGHRHLCCAAIQIGLQRHRAGYIAHQRRIRIALFPRPHLPCIGRVGLQRCQQLVRWHITRGRNHNAVGSGANAYN